MNLRGPIAQTCSLPYRRLLVGTLERPHTLRTPRNLHPAASLVEGLRLQQRPKGVAYDPVLELRR
jgi:hypothetical protein